MTWKVKRKSESANSTAPACPPEIAEALAVSRETLAHLEAYVALLARWNSRINLVSSASLGDVWRRHILDSAQLRPYVPQAVRTLVDLGSGAGFPGLVLSILGVPGVHLVESDRRKAEFLREAARAIGVQVTIHAERIEAVAPFIADVITARALAPLDKLLERAFRFCGAHTRCLFLKGGELADELTAARVRWIMETQTLGSATSAEGYILRVEGLHHAPSRRGSESPGREH
jgi:16S rRNA (guanine527-N7)-methyltransferase